MIHSFSLHLLLAETIMEIFIWYQNFLFCSCGLSNVVLYLNMQCSEIISSGWPTTGKWWVLLKCSKEVCKEVAREDGEAGRKNSRKQKKKRGCIYSSHGLILELTHLYSTVNCVYFISSLKLNFILQLQEPVVQDPSKSADDNNDVAAMAKSIKVIGVMKPRVCVSVLRISYQMLLFSMELYKFFQLLEVYLKFC